MRQNRGLRQTHAATPTSVYTMKSCSCRRTRRAGAIGEQVASELLVEVTILAVLFCCSLLHYKSAMSGFLSTWVGLLSNGVGLFLGVRVLENMPTPLFEQPLKSIAHGCIFESLRYTNCRSTISG